ncbi:MAG: hypothetical protein CMJ63_02760 [Planctomycetaceae bacterium]|nr:hypothetical protein [Planctomycetaceae bacterium]HCA39784.1 hypothetical protein [Phycisphaerales bacterium]
MHTPRKWCALNGDHLQIRIGLTDRFDGHDQFYAMLWNLEPESRHCSGLQIGFVSQKSDVELIGRRGGLGRLGGEDFMRLTATIGRSERGASPRRRWPATHGQWSWLHHGVPQIIADHQIGAGDRIITISRWNRYGQTIHFNRLPGGRPDPPGGSDPVVESWQVLKGPLKPSTHWDGAAELINAHLSQVDRWMCLQVERVLSIGFERDGKCLVNKRFPNRILRAGHGLLVIATGENVFGVRGIARNHLPHEGLIWSLHRYRDGIRLLSGIFSAEQ